MTRQASLFPPEPIHRRVVLFVPASGPEGTGEYYRCLNVARALRRRAPDLALHFLLNHQATVERDPGIDYHSIDATPSRAVAQVSALLDEVQPDLAVFDSSGRASHFRQLKRLGSKVVWISNRPGKRRRGFNPRVIPHLDRHVIARGEFAPDRLNWFERLIQRWLGNCQITFISAITPELGDDTAIDVGLPAGLAKDYAVFVAGGGGYEWQGRPVPELFVEAAAEFHQRTGLAALVVLGPQYQGEIEAPAGVQLLDAVQTEALSRLLRNARLCVAGAGFMISSQILHARCPAVLTAVGGSDQPARVRQLSDSGLVLAASLSSGDLVSHAERLVREPALGQGLIEAIEERGIRNDVGRVAETLLMDLASAGRGI